MNIEWKRCRSYDEAKSFCGIIYLHEWNGQPFYWGICDRSMFGGNARTVNGKKWNPRYGSSYRHWIEGCLRHGGSLYVGTPSAMDNYSLIDLERTLIAKYPSEMNGRADSRIVVAEISHVGDVPITIQARDA